MSRARGLLIVVSLVVFSNASGCSSARYVATSRYEGIVAIPYNTNTWPNNYRKQAEELMAKKFPQGYVIVDESEVVTGQTVDTRTEGNEDSVAYQIFGVGKTRQTTTAHDLKEWQIRFQAKDAPVALAPIVAGGNLPPPAPPGVPLQRVSFQPPEAIPDQRGLPPQPVPVNR